MSLFTRFEVVHICVISSISIIIANLRLLLGDEVLLVRLILVDEHLLIFRLHAILENHFVVVNNSLALLDLRLVNLDRFGNCCHIHSICLRLVHVLADNLAGLDLLQLMLVLLLLEPLQLLDGLLVEGLLEQSRSFQLLLSLLLLLSDDPLDLLIVLLLLLVNLHHLRSSELLYQGLHLFRRQLLLIYK